MTKFLLHGFRPEPIEVTSISNISPTLFQQMSERAPVGINVPGIPGRVEVPRSALTEIKPPLPEEPPLRSVVRNGIGSVFRRISQDPHGWRAIGTTAAYSWEAICASGTPVLLEPATLAQPLPYPHGDGARTLTVEPGQNGKASLRVWDHTTGANITLQVDAKVGYAVLDAAISLVITWTI